MMKKIIRNRGSNGNLIVNKDGELKRSEGGIVLLPSSSIKVQVDEFIIRKGNYSARLARSMGGFDTTSDRYKQMVDRSFEERGAVLSTPPEIRIFSTVEQYADGMKEYDPFAQRHDLLADKH